MSAVHTRLRLRRPIAELAGDDTEFQGALVRLAVGVVVSVALGIGMALEYFPLALSGFLAFFGYFFSLSLLFAAHIALWPTRPQSRPYFSILFDVTTTTIAVSVTGGTDSPLFPLYIWVCVSNGARFGYPHMVTAALASLIMYNGLFLIRGQWFPQSLVLLLHSGFLVVFPLYLKGLLSKLHRARREAESASEAKSAFLANMTHELRTPLVGVSGMSSLLETTELDREQRGYMATLESSARILNRLIDDLLDYSRIEAGRLELKDGIFNPGAATGEAVDMLQVTARAKGLALEQRIAPDLPALVRGDDLRFRQILLNLVGNAVKFTPAGGVRVTASVVDMTRTEARLRFEVEDTGIGMTPDQLAIIFERFRQAEDSSARRFQGAGLGTSIAKRLVELMGGEIGVESTPGQGSRFWFELPLLLSRESGRPSANGIGDANAAPTGPDTDCAILLIEDNPINAKAIATILRKAGYRVDVEEDARGALAVADRKQYRLLFVDMQLPGMDGPELARRWRQGEHGSPVPIVALTANATAADRKTCLDAGMTDFYTKPLDTAHLLEIAATYCDRPVGGPETGSAD